MKAGNTQWDLHLGLHHWNKRLPLWQPWCHYKHWIEGRQLDGLQGMSIRQPYCASIQRSGPIFCLLLGVSLGGARLITGQVTSVTWPVIGWVQSELTLTQKTGPGLIGIWNSMTRTWHAYPIRITDLCEGNPPVTCEFPSPWASNTRALMFSLLLARICCWKNNWVVHDLRWHGAHVTSS